MKSKQFYTALGISPIRTEADYEAALDAIEAYFDSEPEPGTAAADRFDLLATLISSYEREHWPIDPPEPLDAIRYRMEQRGYTQKGSRRAARVAVTGFRGAEPAPAADDGHGLETPSRMGLAGGELDPALSYRGCSSVPRSNCSCGARQAASQILTPHRASAGLLHYFARQSCA